MKNWPLKVLIAFSLLIPFAFSTKTFDPFGIPKIALFYLAAAFILCGVLLHYRSLASLPKNITGAIGFFIVIQIWQTVRLNDISSGLFGAYGQSESLFVQIGFIIFFLASYLFIQDDQSRSLFRGIILVSVFFLSLYGIFQYLFGDPVGLEIGQTDLSRVKSLLGDPNALGAFLVLSIPIVFYEFKRFYPKPGSFLIGGCLYTAVMALFLSFSRSAWLGFLFGLFPLCYQAYLRFLKKAVSKKDCQFALLVFTIIILGFFTSKICTGFQPQYSKDYNIDSRVSSITQGNDSGRALIWSTAWKSFKEAPWLGYGIGSFQVNFHRLQSIEALNFWGPERDLRQVHNETLHYLATQGIIGLCSYVGLLVVLLIGANLLGLFRERLSFEKTVLWSAVFGYLCYIQLNYSQIHYSFLFWIDLGILLGMAKPPSESDSVGLKKLSLVVAGGIIIVLSGVLSFNILQADIHYSKAFYDTRYHHYPQAFSNYRSAVSLTPWNYHYRYRYGLSLLRAAIWESEKRQQRGLAFQYLIQARTFLSDSVKRNPDRYEALFLIGQVEARLGHFSKAVHYYREALHLFPLNYKINYSLAKALWSLDKRKESLKIFQTGFKLNPEYMKSMLAKDHPTFPLKL